MVFFFKLVNDWGFNLFHRFVTTVFVKTVFYK